ncbi:MAG: flagellar biosynthetic protein FliR [Synergistaceae bacterium]|jgi:flagellar biosynthetic protein FliR|nr:flagellar biosynthetic protein FliR [Synergistaceae bacterium]
MSPFVLSDAYVNLILIHLMASVRFLALIMTASVYLVPSLPNPVKFWLAVMLAVVSVPAADASVPGVLIQNWWYLFIMAGREFLIGAAIGFVSSMPLYALQISGFIDGTLMGLNMMNIFDPLSESQTSVLAQMKYMLAIWFYLRWDGHLLLANALAESVRLVPIGVRMWSVPDSMPWMDWIQRAFIMAMRISLPLFGAILLSDVGLGFVARTVPQMNVFVIGIPLKICMGLIVLLTLLPTTVDIFHGEIERAVGWALEGIHFLR